MVIMLGVGRCSGRRSGSPRLSFFFVVKSCKRRSAVDGWMDQSFHSPFFLTCGFCSTHIKKKSGQAQAWKSGLAGRRYVVFLWGEEIGGMREAEEEQ